MPIIKIYKTINYTCVFWRIEEDLNNLLQQLKATPNELNQINKITNVKRKKQNITARLILNYLSKKKEIILYTKNGKPYSKNFKNISISHSKKYCVLLISEKNIGIDIQFQNKNIIKLSSKFVNEKEAKLINKKKIIANLHFIWCAKEAIYKTLHKSSSFKKDIFIGKMTNNNVTNAYYKTTTKYKIIFKNIEDYYFTIAIKHE